MPDTTFRCPDAPRPYLPARERVLYFLGRHLTERDYTDAHDYHRSHLAAQGWLLHGWGVVWGLGVELDPGRKEVVVHPGAAIDPWGRLLVVRRPLCKKLSELTEYDPDATPPAAADSCVVKEKRAPKPDPAAPFLVCVGHTEAEGEPCPVVLDLPRRPHDYRDPDWEPGRVFEAPGLFLAKWSAPDRCWPANETGSRTRFFADAPAAWPPAGGAPGHPLCPPAPCGKPVVPIALIYARGDQYAVSEAGKTFTPGPFFPHALTHIIGVNWAHGGSAPDKLRRHRTLRIWFDRPLQLDPHARARAVTVVGQPAVAAVEAGSGPGEHARALRAAQARRTPGPTGVNRRTFQVFYTTPQDHGRFRQAIPAWVGLNPDDFREAVFVFDRNEECNERIFSGEFTVHFQVVLRCDCVLDANGRAVDGDHLGGGVRRSNGRPELEKDGVPTAAGRDDYRTGDGVEGGTFESWFTLKPRRAAGGGKHAAPGDPAAANEGGENG